MHSNGHSPTPARPRRPSCSPNDVRQPGRRSQIAERADCGPRTAGRHVGSPAIIPCCMLDAHAGSPGLLDRVSERGVLDRLVAGVRAGQSHVLVLRGEAGVGKTALLRHLPAAAGGCQVTWATGVESEMELAFAGLHALCAPLLGRLGALPGPQRDALSTAFGLSAGSPPERFLVGLGGPEPAGRRRRGAAARVHRRRRAVAGPGVLADARVRGAPALGGAGGIRVRGARARRRARCSRGCRSS